MLNAKLVIVGGESKTTEVKLKFPCIVGRGKGSTLLLPHPLVSRQHCELFESNGHLMVRDLGSLNGTYVDNEKIEEALVPAGHLLTIGSVTFRAIYDEPVPGPGDERKTEVVYPSQATVVAEPMPAETDEAPPEAEEFDFESIASEEEAEPAASGVGASGVVASEAEKAPADEPPPEPEDFQFDVDFEEESEGISSEPLFAPDPPVQKPSIQKTVAKITPPAPAAKTPTAKAPAAATPAAKAPAVKTPAATPPAPKPTPAVAKPAATPTAKPATPAAAKPAVAKPAAPAQPPNAEEEEVDEDLDDFLKSLNM